MIVLGLTDAEKCERVAEHCREHGIRKVVVFSPAKFRTVFNVPCDFEHIEWAEIIQYKCYYRLLQEIGNDTLLVINECLRLQNRYDLTYNCLRLFLQQTPHVFVFQYLPLIDTIDDFAILFDFDTRSRWKREPFRPELLKECKIEVKTVELTLHSLDVVTDAETRECYIKEKRKLVAGIGLKDPHTIPRNLYLMSGKAKLPYVQSGSHYVGRNNRFGLNNMQTYRDYALVSASTVFEFCHNFIDFSDFLVLSRQIDVPVMVADLKVDQWYFKRYQDWVGRIHAAYSVLCG